jgi:hypothetical protein
MKALPASWSIMLANVPVEMSHLAKCSQCNVPLVEIDAFLMQAPAAGEGSPLAMSREVQAQADVRNPIR